MSPSVALRGWTRHKGERQMLSISGFNERSFWKKVDIQDERACWPWKKRKDKDGYGVYRLRQMDFRAHRVAFQLDNNLTNAELPEVVCHTCDNPACCNPAHLWGGTQKKNMADKVRKKRQAKGSRNGRAKLTEQQVIRIKQLLLQGEKSMPEIARHYGVSRDTVKDIKREKTWAHVKLMDQRARPHVDRVTHAA